MITVPMSFVSWERPVSELIYVRSGGEYKAMRVHNMRRSEVIDYEGTNPVVLYRKKAAVSGAADPENSDDLYQQVGSVYLEPSLRQPLLFIVEKADGLQLIPMEDSFERFPIGSYRFYNYTSKPLLAKFGESVFKLDAKQTAYLEEPFTADSEFPVVFVVEDEGGVCPLYTNKWQHIEQMRYLILISTSGTRDTSPIKFQILSDYPVNR